MYQLALAKAPWRRRRSNRHIPGTRIAANHCAEYTHVADDTLAIWRLWKPCVTLGVRNVAIDQVCKITRLFICCLGVESAAAVVNTTVGLDLFQFCTVGLFLRRSCKWQLTYCNVTSSRVFLLSYTATESEVCSLCKVFLYINAPSYRLMWKTWWCWPLRECSGCIDRGVMVQPAGNFRKFSVTFCVDFLPSWSTSLLKSD